MPSEKAPEALSVAITLFHLPSGIRGVRHRPVPEGMRLVLRIAAGEAAALDEAEGLTGRSHDNLRTIASFAVEQMLLYPGADSYRVLGVRPDATDGELRAHRNLLLRWLHPDLLPDDEKADSVRRLTRAWGDLKSPERRAQYDGRRAALIPPPSRKTGARPRGILRPDAGDRMRRQPRGGMLPGLLRSLIRFFSPSARWKS